MGFRREGREAAIQFLYQCDLGGAIGISTLSDFYTFRGLSPAARRFCQELVEGILAQKMKTLDEIIQRHAQNYELGRLSAVDRNILRLAVYEMSYCKEVPPIVVINEAISIAKKYGTEESGRFVNGVLDQVRCSLVLPNNTSSQFAVDTSQ